MATFDITAMMTFPVDPGSTASDQSITVADKAVAAVLFGVPEMSSSSSASVSELTSQTPTLIVSITQLWEGLR